MTAFDDALDAVYADPAFGIAALYRPGDGADKPVTVLIRGEDQFGLGGPGAVVEGERVRIRISEVAEARSGDLVEVDDDRLRGRFRVRVATRDARRRQWNLVLQLVADL